LGKKVFEVYMARGDVPNSESYAMLELPASPWEIQDALDKVRLQAGDELYMEIENYHAFSYLMPHFADLDISFNELNDLAGRLAELDEIQRIAFAGFFKMKVQERKDNASGIITIQDCRDLTASVAADRYHIVDASNDAQLGRFYAENDFVPELNDVPDKVFELLDFAKIGKSLREKEQGIYVDGAYVLWDGEPEIVPPCPKGLPEKPSWMFRLTLGLQLDHGDDRVVVLELPATAEKLSAAQEQLGTLHWENAVVLGYDGIIPDIAYFADLPAELESFNEFAAAVRDISSPHRQIPKLKALLDYFEITKLDEAISLTEHLEDYILTPEISSPPETALDQLHNMLDDHSVELLRPCLSLYDYGKAIIERDNARLTPYGLLQRADYQPMLRPVQEDFTMGMEMK